MVFLRNFGQILGITIGEYLTFLISDGVSFACIGSVVLTNELAKKLPGDFLATVPGGVSGAYSAIPLIKLL